MPRAKDNSRGATERETLANIERSRSEAETADNPDQLTALAKAFYHAQRKTKR
jgi:hypothetical protein